MSLTVQNSFLNDRKQKKTINLGRKITIVAIALASLIFTSLASFATEQKGKGTFYDASEIKFDEPEKASQDNPSIATSVFEQVSKSVVIVEAQSPTGKIQGSGVAYDNNRFFGPVSDSAYLSINLFDMAGNNFSRVVTNAHVVTNASRVSVLQGGKRYRAEVSMSTMNLI
jgi:S1-C subfamily serine protease